MSDRDHIVTFGVEIETCIIFSESALRRVLETYQIPCEAIVKGHPLRYQEEFDDAALITKYSMDESRKHYPSWCLARSGDELADDPFNSECELRTPFLRHNPNDDSKMQWIRRLFVEHLFIAKEILTAVDIVSNVCGEVTTYVSAKPLPSPCADAVSLSDNDSLVCPKADHTRWTLTNDNTLAGLLPSQLATALQKDDVDDFSSNGLEIISPVFTLQAKDEAFRAIARVLDALKDGKTCTLVPTVWAGLHVHVGLSTQGDSHLRMLHNEMFVRHLLYILLLHENLISQCFPRSRCGEEQPVDSTVLDAESSLLDTTMDKSGNGDAAKEEDLTLPQRLAKHIAEEQQVISDNEAAVLEAERLCTNEQNLSPNARWFLTNPNLYEAYNNDLTSLYSALFDPRNCTRMLLDYYQARDIDGAPFRGHIYNFSNLYQHMYTSPRQKPTVEFRQHEACIDVCKIARWVRFLEALTRKASAPAQSALGEGEISGEFPPSPQFPFCDISALCTWIGLKDEDVEYWLERWTTHHLDRPSAEREPHHLNRIPERSSAMSIVMHVLEQIVSKCSMMIAAR